MTAGVLWRAGINVLPLHYHPGDRVAGSRTQTFPSAEDNRRALGPLSSSLRAARAAERAQPAGLMTRIVSGAWTHARESNPALRFCRPHPAPARHVGRMSLPGVGPGAHPSEGWEQIRYQGLGGPRRTRTSGAVRRLIYSQVQSPLCHGPERVIYGSRTRLLGFTGRGLPTTANITMRGLPNPPRKPGRPRCATQGSNLGPPRCERGALPLS